MVTLPHCCLQLNDSTENNYLSFSQRCGTNLFSNDSNDITTLWFGIEWPVDTEPNYVPLSLNDESGTTLFPKDSKEVHPQFYVDGKPPSNVFYARYNPKI